MTNVNTKPAKHMHLRYMQNILYTILSQLLYAKDYMKSHWPITLTKDKFKAIPILPHSFRGLPPFFRSAKALRGFSPLVLKERHVLDRKATPCLLVVTNCKSMRLQIKPQPFSVMFAQELTWIFGVNPSPRRIESCYA